jgi:hypothetical protein
MNETDNLDPFYPFWEQWLAQQTEDLPDFTPVKKGRRRSKSAKRELFTDENFNHEEQKTK